MNSGFRPKFITAGRTRIERVSQFLEAAKLFENWVREMGNRVLEAHHTIHIEGARLTLKEAVRLSSQTAAHGGRKD